MPQPTRTKTPSGAAGRFVEYDQFIDEQLDKTGGHVRSVDIAGALLTLIAAMLAFFFVAALADHWLIPGGLGFWGRLAGCVMLFGGTGYYAVREILPLLLHRINPVYAAQTIERSAPSLKNGLVNFLLLKNHRSTISEPVYQAIEAQAAVGLAHTPVEMAVDRSRLIKIGYALAALLLIGGTYKILSPKDPFRTIGRVVLPWANIMPPTRVTILGVDPGSVKAFRGEQVAVSVEVRGMPRDGEARLVYSTSDAQAVDQHIRLVPSAEGLRYTCVLPEASDGVQQDLRYRIEAGDARSEDFIVTMIPAPTIVVQSLDYVYPEYTGLSPLRVEHQGDVKGIEGARVTLHALASQPIASGGIDFDCNGREDERLTVLRDRAGADGADGRREAIGQFTLSLAEDRKGPQHANYQLLFRNEAGKQNPQPVVHRIEVTRDLPPEIEFLGPKSVDLEVPAGASVGMEIAASDPDFALRRVRLIAALGGRQIYEKTLLDEPYRGQFNKKLRFPTARTTLKSGDVVEYWAVAEDIKSPEANRVETPRRRLRIVSPPRRQPAGDQLASKDDDVRFDNPKNNPPNKDPQDNDSPDADKQNQPEPQNGADRDRPRDQTNRDQSGAENDSQTADAPRRDRAPSRDAGDDRKPPAGDEKDRQPGKQDEEQQPKNARDQKGKDQPQGDGPQSDKGEQGSQDSKGGQGSQDTKGEQDSQQQGGGSPAGGSADSGAGGAKQSGGQSGEGASGNSNGKGDSAGQSGSAKGNSGRSGQSGASSGNSSGASGGQSGNRSGGSSGNSPGGSSANQSGGSPSDSGNDGGDQRPVANDGADDGSAIDRILKHQEERERQSSSGQKGAANSQQQPASGDKQSPASGDKPAGRDRSAAGDKSAARDQNGRDKQNGDKQNGDNEAGAESQGGANSQAGADGRSGEPPPGQQGKGPKPADARPRGADKNHQSSQPADAETNGQQPASPDANKPAPGAAKNREHPGDQQKPNESGGDGSKGASDKAKSESADGQRTGQNDPSRSDRGQAQRPNQRGEDRNHGAHAGDNAQRAPNDKGQPGGEKASGDTQASPEAQGENQPRSQSHEPAGGADKQAGGQQAQSPSNSGKQSDSKGQGDSSNGDRSGNGGGKGGGQSSKSPGRGSPGQNTASDEGAGRADSPGDGEDSDRPGADKRSDRPTGKPGSEQGPGSTTRPGPGVSPEERSPQDRAAPDQPSPVNRDSPEKRSPQDKAASGARSGQEGARDGAQPGSEQANRPGPGERGAGQPGSGLPNAGRDEDRPAQPPPASNQGETPAGDEPNLEYARKATDLALERLKDQMARGETDKALLDKLGWSREDLEKFVDRWERMRRDGRQEGPRGAAARRELDEALRSLGLRPRNATVRATRGRDDQSHGLKESRRTAPPAEYAEQLRAYTEGASRGGDGK